MTPWHGNTFHISNPLCGEFTFGIIHKGLVKGCFIISLFLPCANFLTYCPVSGDFRPLNTLRLRQNGRYFADGIIKCIFFNENVWIAIRILLNFIPKGSINNNPTLVQIMAWRRPGDKPLSEPMIFYWHIYVSLNLNELMLSLMSLWYSLCILYSGSSLMTNQSGVLSLLFSSHAWNRNPFREGFPLEIYMCQKTYLNYCGSSLKQYLLYHEDI